MLFVNTCYQWRSQVFESGGTRKPDLPEAFHERRMREFGESGGPPFPRKMNLDLQRCYFRWLEGLTCTLQYLLVDILSISSQFLSILSSIPFPPHFYANLDELQDLFSQSKVRTPQTPRGSANTCSLPVNYCNDLCSFSVVILYYILYHTSEVQKMSNKTCPAGKDY